jgi:methyl-accepting chemotaxis protein
MPRLNIRLKLLLVFMSVFTVFLFGIFYWFYQFSTDRMMSELRQNLIVSASTGAEMIDADTHDRVYKSGAEGDADYVTIAETLRLVRDANPRLTSVYTAVRSPGADPTELLFVVTASEDADHAKLREAYDAGNAPEMIKAFDGPIADVEMGADEFGVWLSGYAPILDKNGQAVAIVGVDMDAGEITEMQGYLRNVSILVFLIAFVSVFVAVVFVSGAMTRSLTRITDAARILKNDEPYEPKQLEDVARGTDELGILANVFNAMAVQVKQREQKLKQEVTQLRIQIDHEKREKQVSEIVDSEFFQDLKTKSETMRKRRSELGREKKE